MAPNVEKARPPDAPAPSAAAVHTHRTDFLHLGLLDLLQVGGDVLNPLGELGSRAATDEYAVAEHLATRKLPVVVVNPKRVRDFAKALGILAKTDRIDAGVIARYAKAVRPELRPLKDAKTQKLDALVARRRQLVEMIAAEKNRLPLAKKWVREDIAATIAWLTKSVEKINKEIDDLIKKHAVWCAREKLLRTATGIGRVTSMSPNEIARLHGPITPYIRTVSIAADACAAIIGPCSLR